MDFVIFNTLFSKATGELLFFPFLKLDKVKQMYHNMLQKGTQFITGVSKMNNLVYNLYICNLTKKNYIIVTALTLLKLTKFSLL